MVLSKFKVTCSPFLANKRKEVHIFLARSFRCGGEALSNRGPFLQGQQLVAGRTPHMAEVCPSRELHPPTVYWQSRKPKESGVNLKSEEKKGLPPIRLMSPGLFNHNTAISSCIILCCEGCPVHCRPSCSMPDLYPLDARHAPSLIVTTPNIRPGGTSA